ncbi:unnamed protein product [Debaryomyces tyrocola]|nr:unnamed protein product [Debaryomyces tyrocola]
MSLAKHWGYSKNLILENLKGLGCCKPQNFSYTSRKNSRVQ